MHSSNQKIKPVVVLGAGPVGLGAAVELARCKVPSILIERNDRTSWHPKTRNFNTRTMEIARRWGREIYEELRELDLPLQWKSPIRFSNTIVGEETGHIESRGFMGAGPEWSPVNSVLSSQDMIEPVLLRQAKRSGMVDIRFSHEMIEFLSGQEPDAQEVSLRVRNKVTGEESILHGSALIAADGASSEMRSLLEMPMHGTAKIAHFINCYFKADLEEYASKRPGILLFVGNEKANGVFQPLDARGRWLCQISVPEDIWSTDVFTPDRCVQWIRDAAGVDTLDVQVQSVGKWQMNAVVAESFIAGRVLLTGDAAHMFPPTGGLGVNTGIQGMHNAVWKLALYLRGKAGRKLLETYTTERRPYARWVAEQSFHNARQVGKMRAISTGKAPPDISKEEVLKETRRYGNQLGLELGSVYESSAVIPDGSAPPELGDSYTDYVPTGRPGHRAPHVWLQINDDRFSTLDLFGHEFTVLTGPKGETWRPVVERLGKDLGLDIGFYVIGGTDLIDVENTFLARYGMRDDGAVLVRPDGWIAWRSAYSNADAEDQLPAAMKRILA